MLKFSLFSYLLVIYLFVSSCPPAVMAVNVVEPDPKALAGKGIAAYQHGDYPGAIQLLSARARLSPEDGDVYYYLGNCYLKTGNKEQAAHMYSACVRVAAASQAGRYSLAALESLSTGSVAEPPQTPRALQPQSKAAAEAASDSLMSQAALDKSFNEAVKSIQNQRAGLKSRVDRLLEQTIDDMLSLNRRNNIAYPSTLERLRREAENKLQEMQTKEIRLESRMLAPDKIDARAAPALPQEKIDDSKAALGSLTDYLKSDKPFDPFGTDIKPELTAKFMTIRDVFGELSVYQPAARTLSKQTFSQLKSAIENKQDWLDQQTYQVKARLILDIAAIQANATTSTATQQTNPAYHIASAKFPRSDPNNLSRSEQEISQVTEATQKRIQELQESYNRDIDSLIARAKERLGGMVLQAGQMNSQLKHPSGNIQMVPLGTNFYVRNYVNFGDRTELTPAANNRSAKAGAKQLHAQAKQLKLPEHAPVQSRQE